MSGPDRTRRWHAEPFEAVLERLGVDPERGLEEREAEARLARQGPNVLDTAKRTSRLAILGRQFVDPLVVILLVAGAVSAAIGEWSDTVTILAIVLLNGVLGFVQEWKAETALAALQQLLSPRARVRRGGRQREIDARSLVPGDIVVLETGDRVGADLRLIETNELEIDESTLTGESNPVPKRPDPAPPDAPLAERHSMAFLGTYVTRGRGVGVVVATGPETELGRIARMTAEIEREPTPLQRKLAVLGRQLGVYSIAIAAAVAAIGWLTGKPLVEMFMTGVSLAVAVVPEGLPAVVTITLALGVRAMVRRRALLRRLQAAEALGEATVVCTDKTGTLTQNAMTVQRVVLPGAQIEVTGVGYAPEGELRLGDEVLTAASRSDLRALLEVAAWCNHAAIERDERGWRAVGEPTEAALIVLARKAGFDREPPAAPVRELPFSSERKRMTVVLPLDGGFEALCKGAPEVLLERCSHVLDGESERVLTADDRSAIERSYATLAEAGFRTLAFARRPLEAARVHEDAAAIERDMTWLGLVGISDPPRPEVPDAIRTAHEAGVRVIMITGDAAPTARAIAARIGLEVETAIGGPELDALSDDELAAKLREPVLFARTSPAHKLRIVSLLQSAGEIVGMTGDGVNDAPALKKADIGIAMGQRGTDVARGAADMVLTDDNFASIVGAIEEGRRQYDNIQKFVRYLLSSNTGEVVAILLNVLLGGPLILLPVQILWMNLVTDGLTALALGIEPAEPGVMRRPPRRPDEPVLDRGGMLLVGAIGLYLGLAALALFHYELGRGADLVRAHTMAFTALVIMEKLNVFNFRSLTTPIREIGWFTNPWVIGAWLLTVGLQLCAVYVPVLQRALHTTALTAADWAVMLVVAAPVFVVVEGWKRWRWRQRAAR